MLRSLLAALALVGSATPALAQSYAVDSRHTHVNWAVNRLGTSTFRGKLNSVSGKVTLDAAAGKGRVDIVIDARGQVTGVESLDRQLMSPSFFNVDKFATATFKSSSVAFNGQAPARIDGDLTLLGVTRRVSLTVSHFHCRSNPISGRSFCGADASATIRRSDWGMTSFASVVGDEVRLDVAIEAFRE